MCDRTDLASSRPTRRIPWNISPPQFHDYPFSSVPFLHDYPLHSDSTLLHLYPFPSGPAPLDLYPFPSGQSLYICIPLCQVLLIFCTIIPFIQASLMALSSLLFSCRFYSVAAFFTRPFSSTPPWLIGIMSRRTGRHIYPAELAAPATQKNRSVLHAPA